MIVFVFPTSDNKLIESESSPGKVDHLSIIVNLKFPFILLLILTPTVAANGGEQEDSRVYAGRTLGEWKIQLNRVRPESQQAAILIPPMLEIMQDQSLPAFTRGQAALTLGRIGSRAKQAIPLLSEVLKEEQTKPQTTFWVCKALGQFGKLARDTAPLLIEFLQNEELPLQQREVTLEPLTTIGPNHPAVIPALVDVLEWQGNSTLTDGEAAEFRALAVESLRLAGPS